jgi:hypothetical protein
MMVYSPLSQLPERFNIRPFSKQMASYVERRWTRYGRKGYHLAYNPEFTPESNKYDRFRFVEGCADGLRFVGAVHNITSGFWAHFRGADYIPTPIIDHTGWFTNHYQDEKIFGEVYQLPARNGKPCYVPAVCDSCNDGASVIDFRGSTHSLRDAILAADHMAENMAESEREYQIKESAETRVSEIGEEIETLYADLKALCVELRANCDRLTGMTLLKKAIRSEVKRTRARVRKLRAERLRLTNEPWTIAEGF